jgi:rhomboid family GlyGly-CTERM serine protease
MKLELLIFAATLVLLNLGLLTGVVSENLVLLPNRIADGEWWRLFSFAWAHNSLYHLVLDGSAFLFLYQNLKSRRTVRIAQLVTCILFSGIVPVLFSPEIKEIGLCGLSGVAHGLMAISAVEAILANETEGQKFGWLLLLGLGAKVAFEIAKGQMLFQSWHLGNVGIPIPSCHLGGLLGGILSGCFLTDSALRDIAQRRWLRHSLLRQQ